MSCISGPEGKEVFAFYSLEFLIIFILSLYTLQAAATDLAKKCGQNPTALRVVGGMLQKAFSRTRRAVADALPASVTKILNDPIQLVNNDASGVNLAS